MTERSGRELLDEWRGLMDAVIASAASAAGRRDLPRDLLRVMRSQGALVQEVIEREQTLQRLLSARLLEPVEVVFDLLEDSATALRRQAETLASAGRALQETADLMAQQAELFERTIRTLRQPITLARSAAGMERPRTRSGKGRAKPTKAKAAKPRGSRPSR